MTVFRTGVSLATGTLAALAIVVTFAAASFARAHDFFVKPAEYEAVEGGVLAVDVTVSAAFPELEAKVERERIAQLGAFGRGAVAVEVLGPTDKSLALRLTSGGPGIAVVAVSTVPREVEYAEDRIPLILEEYQVAPGALAAVEALPRPRTWKVTSTRFAKTFVCVAKCRDRTAAEQPSGLAFEFVATPDGGYRLLAGGKPLADYPVAIVGSNRQRLRLVTSHDGSVRLPSAAAGEQMLFAAQLSAPRRPGDRFALNLTSLTFLVDPD